MNTDVYHMLNLSLSPVPRLSISNYEQKVYNIICVYLIEYQLPGLFHCLIAKQPYIIYALLYRNVDYGWSSSLVVLFLKWLSCQTLEIFDMTLITV